MKCSAMVKRYLRWYGASQIENHAIPNAAFLLSACRISVLVSFRCPVSQSLTSNNPNGFSLLPLDHLSVFFSIFCPGY